MGDNGAPSITTNNHPSSAPSNKPGNNNSAAANEIVRTFEALVRKSSRLFGSLRDLPQFGKFWSNHFQKTFEVYTKLWKYQQQYRNFLEDKEKYGLKRWEIGEIASKIGQLYYHYYLRTSDTNYLHESYIFYEALRSRAYFKDAMDSKIPDLMVKVMRYYARFIVVCLLLNRKKVVLELVDELTKHVDEYIKSLKPTDAQEWYLVLQEVTTFLQADILVEPNLSAPIPLLSIPPPRLEPSFMRNIVHSISSSSVNLAQTTQPSPNANITLQQAILVGNHSHQIKFSELTLEMFRMMLALEFDPEWKDGVDPEREKFEDNPQNKRRNPHKYLLYRPTSAQLLMFIATAIKELHDGRALLVYVNADGNTVTQSTSSGPIRGLLMNAGRPLSLGTGVRVSSASNTNNVSSTTSPDVMYMLDFLPFTRRPLFMIVDSDASSIFKDMPNTFSQPLLCLLSPVAIPVSSVSPRGSQKGNVFTLFLSDPISAFCLVSHIEKINQQLLEESLRCLQSILEVICRVVLSHTSLDSSFTTFMNDDFLRMFILRHVFCYATLSQHKQYSNSPSYLPSSRPDMPQDLLQNPRILAGVFKMADVLGVRDQFIITED